MPGCSVLDCSMYTSAPRGPWPDGSSCRAGPSRESTLFPNVRCSWVRARGVVRTRRYPPRGNPPNPQPLSRRNVWVSTKNCQDQGAEAMAEMFFGPRAALPALTASVLALVSVEISPVRVHPNPAVHKDVSPARVHRGIDNEHAARTPADQGGTRLFNIPVIRVSGLPCPVRIWWRPETAHPG